MLPPSCFTMRIIFSGWWCWVSVKCDVVVSKPKSKILSMSSWNNFQHTFQQTQMDLSSHCTFIKPSFVKRLNCGCTMNSFSLLRYESHHIQSKPQFLGCFSLHYPVTDYWWSAKYTDFSPHMTYGPNYPHFTSKQATQNWYKLNEVITYARFCILGLNWNFR